MGTISIINHLTLDGVMQAPGRADEDGRDGFPHGGWAQASNDEVMARAMGERMAVPAPLLLGRWTYESFFSFWPAQRENPFTEILDRVPKFVASRTLDGPLPWQNSTLLRGEATETVAQLKQRTDRLLVMGSGELCRALLGAGLVDELVLMIHPLVLGAGRRLFDGHALDRFRLAGSVTTTTGVIIATYQA